MLGPHSVHAENVVESYIYFNAKKKHLGNVGRTKFV